MVDGTNQLNAVACVSVSQCTAVDENGNEVTFNATAPTATVATSVDRGNDLLAVACPSASQCTAVDTAGREVTFDPSRAAGAVALRISRSNQLDSVDCPSASECVTVDDVGYGFAGSGPPASSSPPTISGTAQQGQTLSEQHGSWSGHPTSYGYQWLDCDSSGNGCSPIAGASGQSYKLAVSDRGHTIRVRETATNAVGSSTATSAPTGVVSAGPAFSASTRGATTLTTTTAVVNGVVNTGGAAVTWQFQFGQSRKYNRHTPVQSIAFGHGQVPVSRKLVHLQPNTLYHFRLIVTGTSAGKRTSSSGSDLTFRTKPTGRLVISSGKLKVVRGYATVPLQCSSRLSCRGRFSITTKVKTGKRTKLRTVACNTTVFTLSAHQRQQIKAKISAACLSLISHARARRIVASFSARLRTGQLAPIKTIRLSL
jgi:hypothetical protein